MIKSIKKSFLVLCLIAILFIGAQLFLSSYFPKTIFNLIILVPYLWMPGLVALFFSYKEGIKLPVFKYANRHVYWAVFVAMGIFLLAFILTIPFGSIKTLNPDLVGQSFVQQFRSMIFYFSNYYLFHIIGYAVLLLGGELYWRGYLWQKLKSKPYKAVWMIALLWSIWTFPLISFSVVPSSSSLPVDLLKSVVLNFALTPLLLYYRIKSKSILAPTLFCSFLLAPLVYFQILFPSFSEQKKLFSMIAIVLLVLYSLFLKLYSKAFWKHAVKK